MRGGGTPSDHMPKSACPGDVVQPFFHPIPVDPLLFQSHTIAEAVLDEILVELLLVGCQSG